MSFQTQKAVHIAVTNAKDGRQQTTLERRIPLVTIKSIGMSNLRDDWMVREYRLTVIPIDLPVWPSA